MHQYRTSLRKRYKDIGDSLFFSEIAVDAIHADDKRLIERALLLRLMKVAGGNIKQDVAEES